MEIPIFYDIIYVAKSVFEISLMFFGIQALRTYMRRL